MNAVRTGLVAALAFAVGACSGDAEPPAGAGGGAHADPATGPGGGTGAGAGGAEASGGAGSGSGGAEASGGAGSGGEATGGGAAGEDAPVVHWQLNTDRGYLTSFPGYTPVNFVKQMRKTGELPDIVAAQECDEFCACGPDNYDKAAKTCLGAPAKGSLLRELDELLGRPYGAMVAPDNTSIFYARDRFEALRQMDFSSYQTGCGMTASLVLLRDERVPGRHVAAISDHIGNIPPCLVTRVAWADGKLAAWEKELGVELDWVFLSGDWNMRVDTTSSDEGRRRAEMKPDCWWRRLTRAPEGGCGPGVADYIDAVAAKHPPAKTYADDTPICSQFTFNNPASPIPGAGKCGTTPSSGVLWRIDYTFVRGASASPENILAAKVDRGYFDANGDGNVDGGGEKYSGHRAILTKVRY